LKNLFSITVKIFLLFSLVSLLGCSAQPTASPTVDPLVIASTLSAAKTEAVQSVYVKLTQTAAMAPTNTTQPTQTTTMTSVPPTLVPTKTMVLTPAPTIVPTQGAYQCSITRLEPKYGAALTNGVGFDLSVTLKNIGTENWSRDSVDFKYLSGAKFQTKVDAIDLPVDVAAGDSIDLTVDMTANTGTGIQNAAWGLVIGSTTFCPVNVHVTVK
jgi:hypothetical protein